MKSLTKYDKKKVKENIIKMIKKERIQQTDKYIISFEEYFFFLLNIANHLFNISLIIDSIVKKTRQKITTIIMSQDNIYDEENQVQTILKLKRIGIYIYIFLIDSPTRAYSNLLL